MCDKTTSKTQHHALHCVKRVRIWSYSGPHFSRTFPHSDWMWENAGKMRTRITPNTETFHAVLGMIPKNWEIFGGRGVLSPRNSAFLDVKLDWEVKKRDGFSKTEYKEYAIEKFNKNLMTQYGNQNHWKICKMGKRWNMCSSLSIQIQQRPTKSLKVKVPSVLYKINCFQILSRQLSSFIYHSLELTVGIILI